MAQHLMVDLETLDTKTSATILTLGAVRFDPFTNAPMKELYLRVDIDSQDKLGCTVSEDTLQWWSQQNTDVKEEAFNPLNRIPIHEVINQFHALAWGCSHFWGSSFPAPMSGACVRAIVLISSPSRFGRRKGFCFTSSCWWWGWGMSFRNPEQ